jgi:hypothetical protein
VLQFQVGVEYTLSYLNISHIIRRTYSPLKSSLMPPIEPMRLVAS